jgi:hypothetical protein
MPHAPHGKRTTHPVLTPRWRWPLIAPVIVVAVLAVAWSGFWYFSTRKAQDLIAGWLAREAKLGRTYDCGSQSTGGYPFRIEVRCNDAVAELRNLAPAMWVKTRNVLIAAQVYEPTLLISEFTGPLTVGEAGQSPSFTANWTLAQTSVRGLPGSPERISIVFDNPAVERVSRAVASPVVTGKHVEFHVRLAEGDIRDRPVLDIALSARGASAPEVHPLLAQPLDADFDTTLRGLHDLAPKPWPQRFRELQAAGGRIEIKQARVQQGETIAVAAGTLGLTESGRLDGELQVTVAGLNALLPALGIDKIAPAMANNDKVNSALNALDRALPGLGALARDRAGLGLAVGAAFLGEQTQLEGHKAVRLPLRFNDGLVSLGPIPLGKTPPLF